MKIILKTIALAMLATLAGSTAFAQSVIELNRVNFREQDGKVVLEFKASGKIRYRVKEYETPPHLLIQFYDTRSSLPYQDLDVNRGNVNKVSVREVSVNSQTSTFVTVRLNSNVDYDFDLSGDGQTFQMYAGGAKQSASSFSFSPQSQSQSFPDTFKSLPPEIKVPGDQKTGTTQIPYPKATMGKAGEFVVPARVKGMDTSPYIVGPVILQDADISQTIRLLSEAAGGANIVVEAALVQTQSTTGGAGANAGITITLSHITLEDALDIITSSNNWSWRKFGDYYAIMTRSTAEKGVITQDTASVYKDTATPTDFVVVQPRHSFACDLVTKIKAVAPDVTCDASANLLFMRGIEKDLSRARELIATLDVPVREITKKTSQVTKIIRLKYIQLDSTGTFATELRQMTVNPYFGGLSIAGQAPSMYSGNSANEVAINTVTLDFHSNSIIFVGEEEIYNRFYNLIQGIDVPFRATIIKTIPLKYISIRDLYGSDNQSFIEPLEKYYNNLLFSEPTNSITYTGSESGYERLMQILGGLDVEDRQYITRVVKLKYLSVTDLMESKFLDNLVKQPGLGSEAQSGNMNRITKFSYEYQTNSVVISTQKQFMERVVDLLKAVDTSVFDTYSLETIKLKYVYSIRTAQLVDNIMQSKPYKEGVVDGGFFAMPSAKLVGSGERLSGENPSQGHKWVITPDTQQNAVMILARPQEMEIIKKIIAGIDKPYPQLKLDVQIVELMQTDVDRYKLAYVAADGKFVTGGDVAESYGDFSLSRGGEDDNTTFIDGGAPDLDQMSGMFMIYNTLTNHVASFASSLQVAVEKVNGRVVANPTMIAPEGSSVSFDFSDQRPYIVYGTATREDGTTMQTQETRYATEGFTFTALPHFVDDYVVLDISISANQIKSIEGPILGTREINTEVKCKDGQPIILGGMVRSSESLTSVSLPLVSKLPVIGSLFRRKYKEITDSEVVIIITPTIMNVE
ncbi:MAG: Type II secretion system protein D precursor [bacterium ADurb.Bin236]|nr:MAG: Type II secretion system protein D precursor [bacterium ADurb.Bin236]